MFRKVLKTNNTYKLNLLVYQRLFFYGTLLIHFTNIIFKKVLI